MCGICGCIDLSSRSTDELQDIVRRMSDALVHRGPDSDGYWVDANSGLGFGHRRLAVIDRSEGGHQPMHSHDERWVLSYNGEIYNFRSLRDELLSCGVEFRGHSDTEVVLAACAIWGPLRALERLNGMFAFSLWDRKERVLYLARDRVGEKPLYYGWLGKSFVFASELKALMGHPEFDQKISRASVTAFFQRGYVPAPRSIFSGVSKLPPASYVKVSMQDGVVVSEPVCLLVGRGGDTKGGGRSTANGPRFCGGPARRDLTRIHWS